MIDIKKFKPQHGQDILAKTDDGYFSCKWDAGNDLAWFNFKTCYDKTTRFGLAVNKWILLEDFENFAFDRDVLSNELDDAFSYIENHKDNQWKD